MKISLIVFLTFIFSISFGQISDSLRKRIDRYKVDIDKKLKRKKLVEKEYPEMSPCGGSLHGYYLNKKLVLITAEHDLAYCFNTIYYYIIADALVFVTETIELHQWPDEEYLKKHTDKNNNTNLAKLPLEADDNNKFYLQDSRIVDCEMRSFNKKQVVNKDVLAEKNKMILDCYNFHLVELKSVP
jgi:hypothetical protein